MINEADTNIFCIIFKRNVKDTFLRRSNNAKVSRNTVDEGIELSDSFGKILNFHPPDFRGCWRCRCALLYLHLNGSPRLTNEADIIGQSIAGLKESLCSRPPRAGKSLNFASPDSGKGREKENNRACDMPLQADSVFFVSSLSSPPSFFSPLPFFLPPPFVHCPFLCDSFLPRHPCLWERTKRTLS